MSGDIPEDKLAFLDDLAAVVDGDAETLQKHAELLADSDEFRDLRHEVTRLASRLQHAGVDYVSPPDLDARVLAAIDSRAPAPCPAEPPVEGASGPLPQDAAAEAAQPPVEGASGPLPQDAAAEAAQPPVEGASGPLPQDAAAEAAQPPVEGASVPKPQPPQPAAAQVHAPAAGKWLVLALGAAAAAIFALGIVHRKIFRPKTPDPNAHLVAPAPENPMTARLATILRAAHDGSDGVEIRDANGIEPASVVLGSTVGGGGSIRTDGRTRVELAISDGSVLVLNHNTELALDSRAPRRLHLRYGEVLADTESEQDGPRTVFVTPAGRLETRDAKFDLAVSQHLARVDVLRGAVRLLPKGRTKVRVLPGEEGLMPKNGQTSVAPITGIAGLVGWSELGVEWGAGRTGLGELRAHVIGAAEEAEQLLALTEHKVAVQIVGNVARTEVEETFGNESQVALEGVYRFALPPDARMAGLWLRLDGQWQEGAWMAPEPASSPKRRVIRSVVSGKTGKDEQEFVWLPGPWRDPALLQWKHGRGFRLPVSPIPAGRQRSIRFAYTQAISPKGSRRRYVYPLPHAGDEDTPVDSFQVEVRATGVDGDSVEASGYAMRETGADNGVVLKYGERDFLPAGDLIIDYGIPAEDSGLRWWSYQGDATVSPPARMRHPDDRQLVKQHEAIHGDKRPYLAFALQPTLSVPRGRRVRDCVFVLDASQSMVGERFLRARKLTERIVAELDPDQLFTVLACDAGCQLMNEKPLPPSTRSTTQLRAWLSSIQPAGASDLVAAIGQAVGSLKGRAQPEGKAWLVYIGDGIATVGHIRPASMAAEVQALVADQHIIFTAVGVGTDADALRLSALARAAGGHYVAYLPGQRLGAAALAVLETTFGVALEDPTIELPEGVVDVVPRTLATVRAGEELFLVGRLLEPEVQGEIVLRGTVAGEPFAQRHPVSVKAATTHGNAFLPQVWASKTIEELELQNRPESRTRILALSQAYQVMSRQASLRVLGNEAVSAVFDWEQAWPSLRQTGDEQPQMAGPSAASFPLGSFLQDVATVHPPDTAGAGGAPPAGTARKGKWGTGAKRAWVRRAQVEAATPPQPQELQASEQAARALQENPHSRDRHRSLVRALCRLGQLEQAHQLASQWVARDRLDPEALAYLSDIAGREGNSRKAMRLLMGVIDLQPDNRALQEHLASAFERAGMAERACAHRVALAETLSEDVEVVAAAVRCERALGHEKGAQRLLSALSQDAVRQAVLERAEQPGGQEPAPGRGQSELVLDATWVADVDVDLTLVTPLGTRVSWLSRHTGVTGSDARSVGREQLALHRVSEGSYILEVSRLEPHDTTPVKGNVGVHVLGEERSLPFRLEGPRTTVGRITIYREPESS